MNEPFENVYFSWLCAKVSYVEVPTPSLTYFKLFRKLFSTEFVWLMPGDQNRAEDGLELRYEFLITSGMDDEFDPHDGCSIFEMLIAFARRAEFMAGETPEFWFWLMLENLELKSENDSAYDEAKVDKILEDLIWRVYDERGHGSLFPLNTLRQNQQETEIWYQFSEWLEDVNWSI